MHSLIASMQTEFRQRLFDPLQAIPEGITAPDGACATSRFNVYRNNVTSSLIDAVASTFPVTEQAIGIDYFRQIAREFIREQPPANPVLAHYGTGFDQYLQQQEELREWPFLGPLAQLEWLYVQSFHAADSAPISAIDLDQLQSLLAIPEQLEHLRLTLHPALHLIASQYAIGDFWAAHQVSHDDADAIQAAVAAINLDEPQSLLIARNAEGVYLLPVEDSAFTFIAQLHVGRTLPHAVAAAQENLTQTTNDHDKENGLALFDPTPALVLLLSHGLLTGFSTSPDEK